MLRADRGRLVRLRVLRLRAPARWAEVPQQVALVEGSVAGPLLPRHQHSRAPMVVRWVRLRVLRLRAPARWAVRPLR